MLCGSVHQIAAIVQFPRLDGLERARLKKLRIDNIRLRTRRMRVPTTPLQRAPTTAEHSRFRARFEIAVTVPTPCDRFDPVDGTELPQLREVIKKDIQAAYDGDPAARSLDEVIVSYPGLKAITIQRLAHILYKEGIPMIPRIMTEYAHRITAIDIHPGATIGEGFFIDHGTGVVVGETATIGNNVKLYQGVTLGAHSFPKDACGKIIKGAKRHPNIEDNVTIYAGATILGNITIGANSIIGGNVWLTEDIPAGTKVRIADPQLTIKKPKETRV